MRRLLAAILLLAPIPAPAQRAAQRTDRWGVDTSFARPVAPVVVNGACPFECCQYGDWTLLTAAPLREAPSPAARVLLRIPRRSAVRSDSGIVRVTRVGLLRVMRTVRAPDLGIDYQAGDTVRVLDYLGEGFYTVWYRGRQSPSPVGFDDPDLRVLARPRSEWWAHVTWRGPTTSVSGWIRMDDVEVRGADGCAGPCG